MGGKQLIFTSKEKQAGKKHLLRRNCSSYKCKTLRNTYHSNLYLCRMLSLLFFSHSLSLGLTVYLVCLTLYVRTMKSYWLGRSLSLCGMSISLLNKSHLAEFIISFFFLLVLRQNTFDYFSVETSQYLQIGLDSILHRFAAVENDLFTRIYDEMSL